MVQVSEMRLMTCGRVVGLWSSGLGGVGLSRWDLVGVEAGLEVVLGGSTALVAIGRPVLGDLEAWPSYPAFAMQNLVLVVLLRYLLALVEDVSSWIVEEVVSLKLVPLMSWVVLKRLRILGNVVATVSNDVDSLLFSSLSH